MDARRHDPDPIDIPTLFERLGGMVSIDVAVDRFYDRLLADPDLAGFFDQVDLRRLRAHQKAFLAMALGGPRRTGAAASPRPTRTWGSTIITWTSWPATSRPCSRDSACPRRSSTRSCPRWTACGTRFWGAAEPGACHAHRG